MIKPWPLKLASASLLAPLFLQIACADDHNDRTGTLGTREFAVSGQETSEISIQSEDEALATDLQLVADARGWTFDEALRQHQAAAAVGDVAIEVAKKRPDAFVGSRLSKEPGGTPALLLKGEADKEILDIVRKSPLAIEVVDRLPLSAEDIQDRQGIVHDAFLRSGQRDVVVWIDPSEGQRIHVAVPSSQAEVAANIAETLPIDLRTRIDLSLVQGPVVRKESQSLGGMLVSGSPGTCTSGWTVAQGSTVITGVSTAGHCNTMSTILHPPSTSHSLTYQAGGDFSTGDVSWYLTNASEPATFYANNTTIRATLAVESLAGISVGEAVCFYSRLYGARNCSLDVQFVDTPCGGNKHLTIMNGDVTDLGDSGGGWSFNNTAYGGHMGDCVSKSSFTAAGWFDITMGATVRVQ